MPEELLSAEVRRINVQLEYERSELALAPSVGRRTYGYGGLNRERSLRELRIMVLEDKLALARKAEANA